MSIIDPVFSPYVFGIDLGTTNSVIAVHRSGEAQAIPIGMGKVLPSVVRVLETGDIQVGEVAKRGIMVAPEDTVSHVKRHLGTGWKKTFRGIPGKEFSAVDISAAILNALASKVLDNEDLELGGSIRQVVICVPANFLDDQRRETKEAAALANLEVLALLEEPSAAAIAYALDKERDQTILVYDLGGGTFDVSILEVKSNAAGHAELAIKAKGGVAELGGIDFDRKLMALAIAKLVEQGGPDILDLKKDAGIRIRDLREAQARLHEVCEAAKKELTESPSTEIMVANLVRDEDGRTFDLDFTITRDEFEAEIVGLVTQTMETIKAVLEEAKMTMDDINRIVLVGGSTRVPLVRQTIRELCGKDPYSDADPETIVARGAAIYASALSAPRLVAEGEEAAPTITIHDKVSHYLGLEATDSKSLGAGRFSRLLEKGADIPPDGPLTVTQTYTTGSDMASEIRLSIYQADEAVEYLPHESARCIGEFFVKLPVAARGVERVEVTFAVDQQNMLRVSAKSSSSEANLEIRRG